MMPKDSKPDPAHTDEVDRIVAAWRRERPDLDPEPMQVWSRVSRLAQLLNAARTRTFRKQGLQLWEFDVLAALRRSGEPYQLSPGQLTSITHVTSGTMTNRVDRLTERGLVTRHANPTDGRGVLVALTAEGSEKLDAAIAELVAIEARMMAELDDQECAQLAGMLRRLLLSQ